MLRERGRTRRIPVGDRGIARAVFVDAAVYDGPGCPGAWGEVRPQDRDGAQVARVPLGDRLPNRSSTNPSKASWTASRGR
ncbi:hypothetical protein AB0K88_21030 [Streptomyces werraensis]|uniref:hypothetical protein n=1 Tax=Streptomyces werraensis TaxID=68284 RepID=UPI0034244BCD